MRKFTVFVYFFLVLLVGASAQNSYDWVRPVNSTITNITIITTNNVTAGVSNGTDVYFSNVSVNRNLTVVGDINLTGGINCQNIVGGTDSDFCSDGGGSGGGSGGIQNGTDAVLNELTIQQKITLPDGTEIEGSNGQQVYFENGNTYFVI